MWHMHWGFVCNVQACRASAILQAITLAQVYWFATFLKHKSKFIGVFKSLPRPRIQKTKQRNKKQNSSHYLLAHICAINLACGAACFMLRWHMHLMNHGHGQNLNTPKWRWSLESPVYICVFACCPCYCEFVLTGYCTPNQKLPCFVLYFKLINTFLKINICVL